MHYPSRVHHLSLELEAKLKAQVANYPPSPRLSAMFGQSFVALQPFGSRLHEQDETSWPPLPPCPSALSFFSDQQVQAWMAKTAEEEEEEIWKEEEEVWTGWISPVHLFRAEILLSPSNFFGISFGYPFRPKL